MTDIDDTLFTLPFGEIPGDAAANGTLLAVLAIPAGAKMKITDVMLQVAGTIAAYRVQIFFDLTATVPGVTRILELAVPIWTFAPRGKYLADIDNSTSLVQRFLKVIAPQQVQGLGVNNAATEFFSGTILLAVR